MERAFLKLQPHAFERLNEPEKAREARLRTAASFEAQDDDLHDDVRIAREKLEEWTNALLEPDLQGALRLMAVQTRFLPSPALIAAQAAKDRERGPLLDLMPRRTLDSGGRIVGRQRTKQEAGDNSQLDRYQLSLSVGQIELSLALDSLETKKALNTDALIALFEDGLFYRSQTLDMIRVGLDRYFAHDYVSATTRGHITRRD